MTAFRVAEKLGLKAELRNPDEFYHKMNSATFVDGEHRVVLKGNQEKARRLNEDRNIAIVNMKRQAETKKAEKLKKSLHLIDFPKDNSKISFVGSYSQIKDHLVSAGQDDGEAATAPKVRLDTEKIRQEVAILQSENK